MGISTLKSWHFEANEDIITKFKSQGLYIIEIKYSNASGSGFPPSLIPALRNIGILHYKKTKLCKHLQHSVQYSLCFLGTLFFQQYIKFKRNIQLPLR